MHVCSKACKPGECPAIYTGTVTRDWARVIHSVTRQDDRGRLYFLRADNSWKHLRSEDYPELNRILDEMRPNFV